MQVNRAAELKSAVTFGYSLISVFTDFLFYLQVGYGIFLPIW